MAQARDKDISQDAIIEKFSLFTQKQGMANLLPDIIKEKGHCVGFTVIASYAKWLELNQLTILDKDNPETLDDWQWLEKTFQKIVRWNGTTNSVSKKSKRLSRQIHKILCLIEFFQNPQIYLQINRYHFAALLNFATQNDFIKEYTIAGLFTQNSFTKSITIGKSKRKTNFFAEVVKENRMVFILVYDHICAVIKQQDTYYFYDANIASGWIRYADCKELVARIFKENKFLTDKAYSFSFYCVSENGQNQLAYPAEEELLKEVAEPAYVTSSDKHYNTGLHAAAEVHCLASFKFYLNTPPIQVGLYICLLNVEGLNPLGEAVRSNFYAGVKLLLENFPAGFSTYEKACALSFAVKGGFVPVVELLLTHQADPNFLINDQLLLAHTVKLEQSFTILKLLLQNGARPNNKNTENLTALHICAAHGNLAGLKLLIQYGGDVNAKTVDQDSVFYYAAVKKHYAIMDFLLHLSHIKLNNKDYKIIAASGNITWLDIAQYNVMLQMVKGQIDCLEKIDKNYYSQYAKPTFLSTVMQIDKTSLNPRCRTLLLLNRTLPIFINDWIRRSSEEKRQQFIATKEPIKNLIALFKISYVDINRAEEVINATTKDRPIFGVHHK